ncbi:adenosine deaminase [Psychrobacter immobilis]|uniref:adenosine deaminase n=1 Tax=Psychrobacter immobilis TaxID=498 RepID=UPI0019184A64|nr:adenosine deaminase [Psychrobacter immobilis]
MNLNSIKKLKKGELHVHLNGLVSTEVIKMLIRHEHCDIPNDFDLNTDLTILKPANSLIEYLKPWQVLRLIPNNRESLKLIVKSAFINLKADNVDFVEIRNSVIYIALLNKITVKEALLWLITEIEDASYRYDIKAGLILTVSRGDYALEHLRALLKAYKYLGLHKCIVGLDLAGNEDIDSPKGTGQLFQKAKADFGLNVTIHAGETGNCENIKKAIIDFGADRIGHGTAASKSNEVMDLLKERNICLEICPISNRLTKAVAEHEHHPVKDFIDNDIPFVICSDNPAIHSSSLSFDYYEFLLETKNTLYLSNMYSNQKKYSFLKGLS